MSYIWRLTDSEDEEQTEPWCFYLSAWQADDSPCNLLIVRSILFLLAVTMVVLSQGKFKYKGIYRFWPIYFTHWGLLLLVLTTGLSVAISALECVSEYESADDEYLPWYMKLFWILYNIANPVTYMISIFYWTVLYKAGVKEELDAALDVAVHALNSLVMVVLAATSMVPSRMRHVYQPVAFTFLYMIFSIVYFLSGGVDASGHRYVYSVINWSRPGQTMTVIMLIGVLLIFLHFLTVLLAKARDALAKNFNNSIEDDRLVYSIVNMMGCRRVCTF